MDANTELDEIAYELCKYTNDSFESSNLTVNIKLNNGETLLIRATRIGEYDKVKRLIQLGADVNLQDDTGYTALHVACFYSRFNIVCLLINNFANCDIPSNGGRTCLISACHNGDNNIIQKLFDIGANICHADNQNYTPLIAYASNNKIDSSILRTLIVGSSNVMMLKFKGKTAYDICNEKQHDVLNYCYVSLLNGENVFKIPKVKSAYNL